MSQLNISEADILGFSNGAQTAIEIAIRYPDMVSRLILASTFYKLDAAAPQFWDGFKKAVWSDMPLPLQEGYLAVNNSEEGLLNMFNKDVKRMKTFTGWTDEQIKTIQAPTLVLSGSIDVASLEHSLKMYRTIPDAELAILPGGHGTYLGTIESTTNGVWTSTYGKDVIEVFLNKPKSLKC